MYPITVGKGWSSQSSYFSSTSQVTCFVVWNIREVSNDNFRRNFKLLINTHNPCLVALLETKVTDHLGLVHEFGFDEY